MNEVSLIGYHGFNAVKVTFTLNLKMKGLIKSNLERATALFVLFITLKNTLSSTK